MIAITTTEFAADGLSQPVDANLSIESEDAGRQPRAGKILSIPVFVLGTIAVLLAVTYIGAIFTLGTTKPALAIVGHSMNPLLYQGDLAIIKTTNPADVQVGDVISLSVTPANQQKYGLPATIVHRVASIQDAPAVGRVFTTKGDNNPERDSFITLADNVNGVMVAHVPKAGYPLLYVQGPSAPLLGAVVAGLILTYIVLGWAESRGKEAKAREEIITRLAIGLPTLQSQIEQLSFKLAADSHSAVGTLVQHESVAVTQPPSEPSPYTPPVALLSPPVLEQIAEPVAEEIVANPAAEEIGTDEIVVESPTEPIAPALSELPPPAPVGPPVTPTLSQLPPPSLFTQIPTKTRSHFDPLTAPIEDVLAHQAVKEAQRR